MKRRDNTLNIEHIDALLENIRRLEENLNAEETPIIEEQKEIIQRTVATKETLLTRLKTVFSKKFWI